jgi:hypothetical protein
MSVLRATGVSKDLLIEIGCGDRASTPAQLVP